jgi:hypothetical protein
MLKYVLAWLPLLLIAVVNGAVRQGLYADYLGELRAHQVSTLSGILLFGIYIWWLVRLHRPSSSGQAVAIGFVWLGMTVAFEFLCMHYAAGRSWDALLHEYNILAGRVWVVVLVWITIAPYVFYRFGPAYGRANDSTR